MRPTTRPATDMEHLHGRFELVVGEADHVEVFVPVSHHLLTLDGFAHRHQPVPQPGRLLELQLVGGLAHLRLEPLDDGVGVAVEEVEELTDERVVVLLVDRGDARAAALLDVVQQARPAQLLVPAELVVRAGPQRERPQEQIERLADRVRVAVRSEVPHALAPRSPHDHRTGPLVGRA